MAAGGGIEGKDAPSNQAPDACIIPWGLCLVFSRPPAGKRGDRIGWYRGEGCDLTRPGSWHEPIHAEDGPLKHVRWKKLPPKTHTPVGWRLRTTVRGQGQQIRTRRFTMSKICTQYSWKDDDSLILDPNFVGLVSVSNKSFAVFFAKISEKCRTLDGFYK